MEYLVVSAGIRRDAFLDLAFEVGWEVSADLGRADALAMSAVRAIFPNVLDTVLPGRAEDVVDALVAGAGVDVAVEGEIHSGANVMTFLRAGVGADLEIDAHVSGEAQDHRILIEKLLLRRIGNLAQPIRHRSARDHIDISAGTDIEALEQDVTNHHLGDIEVGDGHLGR